MKNIILVGYMGCGKSTIGKCFSKASGMVFLDTDEMIEAQQGKSISTIFAEEGEAAFRDMETEMIKSLIAKKKEGYVISTGGGMPVREENRSLLKQLGTVFYLKAMPETVYERVKDDTKRPLLQCEDPLGRICGMLEQRGPAYENTADYVVAVDDCGQQEIVDQIMEIGKAEGVL